MVSKIYIDDSAERWKVQRDQFTGRSYSWRYADEVFAHHLLTVHEMYCQEPVCVKNKLPAKPALGVAMDLLGLAPMVQLRVSSDAPSSAGNSREGPMNELTLQSEPSGCETHQDALLNGSRGLHKISQTSSSSDHAYCRNMGEKTILREIKKEIIEEPGYQTYTVKEAVLGEGWTEQSTGHQEARSTEQPEMRLVKEEVLEHDSTGGSGGQEILTELMSTEQPEMCLVKEKQVAAGWAEESEGGDKIVIEPKSSETCSVKDQEEESTGGLTEDSGASEICRDPASEESVHKTFSKRTKDDNSKEMETELTDESDYEMYEVKEEPLESSCTENDSAADLAPVLAMRSNRESMYTQESHYTKRQLKFSLHVFQEFCIAGGIPFDHLTDINLQMLDQLLGKFYTGVKTTSDKSYSLKSMQALRYGLQKHFLHVRGIDIIKDKQFAKSRYMFKCVLQKLKKERKPGVEQKPVAVSESDMNKIQDSLDQNTPCGLQSKVFVDICSNFTMRGVEELYNMQPNDILLFLSEQHGLRYFRMAKKHTQTNQDDSNCQGERMFEIPGSNRCPVAALLKYKSKLNYNFPFLWQKPKKAGREHGSWYDSVRMGVKRLQRMMITISSEAGCLTIYTNHSLTSRITGKETMMSVMNKEVVQEPEQSEEPGYQTYTVKEAVLEEDWTEQSAGHQEILTEQMSTEQPETCLIKEEVLEEDWTEDDRGQELLTQPTLTEQPETCLVKEEVLEEDWTEDDRGQELLTQPTSTEQSDTCLIKEEVLEQDWTEDSEGGHGIVKEPHSGGWTEDLEATWVCQIAPLEESIHKRDLTDSLQEERRRAEVDNSKEVETELSDESDYEMYEVKEEPLESSCTENDDLANLKMLLQAPLLALKSNSKSKNTKRQLKHSLQVFQEFCIAGDIEFDQLSDVNLETLDQLLGKFYTGVKSTSDKLYSVKSMQALRYGLQKHFLHLRDIDIVKDKQFAKSRCVFNAVIQKLKKEGKADIKHHKPVSESDMNKIQDSLDQNTPCGLQSKVFVDICSNFAFSGVEELYNMRPNDFLLSEENGLRYFYMAKKPTQINPDDPNSKGGRMFEIPGSNQCPVAALLKYKSKLNYNLPFFWQKPKKAGRDHGPWYDNVRMGVKRLPRMMKMISSEAGCSTIYTNHSLTYMYKSNFKWY